MAAARLDTGSAEPPRLTVWAMVKRAAGRCWAVEKFGLSVRETRSAHLRHDLPRRRQGRVHVALGVRRGEVELLDGGVDEEAARQ